MKVLTFQQLSDVMNSDKSKQIKYTEADMVAIFERYGDDYFKDYGYAPFVLVNENPLWKDKRGQPGYPREGDEL